MKDKMKNSQEKKQHKNMKQETIHYLNLLGHTATGFHCNQYIFKNLLKSESLKF